MIIYRPPKKHSFSTVKIAFLTGLSDPEHCELSSVQTDFLKRLDCPEEFKVYLNFPYLKSSKSVQQTPLWKASFANSKQFFLASSKTFQDSAKEHLDALANSTDKLILILGSCGLEILNNALSNTALEKLDHVIAFGPVAKQAPYVSHKLIQGSRDYVSQFFFKDANVKIPNLGHMGYLKNQLVFECINEDLCYRISNL